MSSNRSKGNENMKTSIINNHKEEFEYPCEASHFSWDGQHSFPADMLYWRKDGFYCEGCIEDDFLISLPKKGRSLKKEIELPRQRGKCHRPLPNPIYFGGHDEKH